MEEDKKTPITEETANMMFYYASLGSVISSDQIDLQKFNSETVSHYAHLASMSLDDYSRMLKADPITALTKSFKGIEHFVIEYLKGRNATKEDPYSEYWDGETWEDFWLENNQVISRMYIETEEGEKKYWDENE